MPVEDPWLWTVDDLVAEVCHSTNLFDAVGHGPLNGPNLRLLEAQIRYQQVAGAAFLTEIDPDILRDDLNINTLEQRTALKAVIDLLRARSTTYRQHIAVSNVEALNIGQHIPSSSYSGAISSEMATVHGSGRKRRKLNVTHISTTRVAPGESATHNSAALQANAGQEWDFLKKWEQDHDTEAEIGENSEGYSDNDVDEEPVDVVDEDELKLIQDRQVLTEKLSRDQIVNVINERIEDFANTWYPGKGEEHVPDPEKLWEVAEAENKRNELIQRYEAEIAYLENRLDRTCDEILKVPWNKQNAVRRQCSSLEGTVESLELAQWLLSIYKLDPLGEENDELSHPNSRPLLDPGRPQKTSPQIIDLGSSSGTNSDTENSTPPDNVAAVTPIVSLRDPPLASQGSLSTPKSPIAFIERENIAAISSQSAQGNPLPRRTFHDEPPEMASIRTVARWSWRDLTEQRDRKRIVMKVLHEMSSEDRETIRTRMGAVKKEHLLLEIPYCISMFLRRENKIQGVLPRDLPKLITVTRLFLSWWLADNLFQRATADWRLEELTKCLEEGSADPDTFYDWVHYVLANTFSKEALEKPYQPSQAEIVAISEAEES